MFEYKKFDVDIAQNIDIQCLAWPQSDEVSDESNPGCNRDYSDLRRIPWAETERIFQLESDLLERIENGSDCEEEVSLIEDELCEDPDGGLYGLDMGVASTVAALSSAKCIPITSCNAAAFGGRHLEIYPLVVFYARLELIAVLLKCAKEANVGLETNQQGFLIVYADDIRCMRNFARQLINLKKALKSLKQVKGDAVTISQCNTEQLVFFAKKHHRVDEINETATPAHPGNLFR